MELWMSIVGVIMAFAGLPQIYTLITVKSSKSINRWLFYIVGFGQANWLFYGIKTGSISLIITNLSCLCITLIIIYLCFKYKE